jgi:putative aldouronate transport system substrate-binding protein
MINISGPEASERLNVLLSSGDYPDVISNLFASINDMNYWATQGVLQDIEKYNPTSYPNIKALLDKYPFLDQRIRGADGKMYALPTIQECLFCTYSNRLFYYMPWVRDAYNNKKPDTTDELTAYLRYIRDNDVNGNGNKNDEIPLAIDKDSIESFINYFAASFLPWVASSWGPGIANKNGKVVDQATDPAFRDTLRYLTGLYKEGLIAPNSFTITADELKVLLQAETPIVGMFPTAWKNWYMSAQTPRYVENLSLKPLAGPKGVRHAAHLEISASGSPQWMITDKCKDPELAIALYNYLIDFEINMDASVGPKGISWDYPDAGSMGLDGGKPTYKLLTAANSAPLNSAWDKGVPVIYTAEWFVGSQTTGIAEAKRWYETGDKSVEDSLVQNVGYVSGVEYHMTGKEHEQYGVPESNYVPSAILSDDDSTRLSDINAALVPFKKQAWIEFITGVRNINSDSDWNAYVSELGRYGDNDLLTLLQKYNK